MKDKRNVISLFDGSRLERKQENKHTKPVKQPNVRHQILLVIVDPVRQIDNDKKTCCEI